jgi:hypothetical protein
MKAEETAVTAQSLAWLKSSYSGAEGGDCVQVAASGGTVHVRDSKDKAGAVLTFAPAAWAAFVGFAAELNAPAGKGAP